MTVSDNLFFGLVGLLWMFGAILLLILLTRTERLLDRYRLKYGFDKEIEFKEVGGNNELEREERIKKRERLWRRRVFRD